MGDTSVLGREVLSLAGDSNASQIHTVFPMSYNVCHACALGDDFTGFFSCLYRT